MTTDIIQLALWIVLGIFITWGIFFAWVGFRSVKDAKNRRLARTSANAALILGIVWICLWVTAVTVNVLQILGIVPT